MWEVGCEHDSHTPRRDSRSWIAEARIFGSGALSGLSVLQNLAWMAGVISVVPG